jgi:hypothetical protein
MRSGAMPLLLTRIEGRLIDARTRQAQAVERASGRHAFDCIGAKSAGMYTAFIDRRKRPFGRTPHQPDLRLPDMQSLADAMT